MNGTQIYICVPFCMIFWGVVHQRTVYKRTACAPELA